MDFDYDELNIKEKNKTPLWIYHGEEDEFVSEENAKMSYDQIKSVGVDFEWTTEKGLGHWMLPDEIHGMRDFLTKNMLEVDKQSRLKKAEKSEMELVMLAERMKKLKLSTGIEKVILNTPILVYTRL
jgi:predicted peptidase